MRHTQWERWISVLMVTLGVLSASLGAQMLRATLQEHKANPTLGPQAHVFRFGSDLQRECSGFSSSSFTAHSDGSVDILPIHAGCFEYILGASDGIQMASKDVVCLPTRVTATSVVLAVTKYIDAHPEELHKSAVSIVRKALSSGFPCR